MHRTQAAAAAFILAATAAAAPALATPASGFTRTELSTGLLEQVQARGRAAPWEVRVRTRGNTTLGLDQLTVVDHGHSGWHTHAGLTMVTVVSGEVTWYDGAKPDCPAKTYHVGESFIEPANNVHLVHNTTGNTVVFTAVQMRPENTPGRIDAAHPTDAGCPVFN
jgi:quercetin dioxygenase-like cupin family protein